MLLLQGCKSEMFAVLIHAGQLWNLAGFFVEEFDKADLVKHLDWLKKIVILVS